MRSAIRFGSVGSPLAMTSKPSLDPSPSVSNLLGSDPVSVALTNVLPFSLRRVTPLGTAATSDSISSGDSSSRQRDRAQVAGRTGYVSFVLAIQNHRGSAATLHPQSNAHLISQSRKLRPKIIPTIHSIIPNEPIQAPPPVPRWDLWIANKGYPTQVS
ncbi:MAG: hypothetical protein ACI9R3_003218 [Verrucomicrobiales bacterium]|jgi:hypothetical protein